MQYILFLLFLIGCGTETIQTNSHSLLDKQIPEKNWGEFSDYVDDFVSNAKVYGKDQYIRLDTLKVITVVDKLDSVDKEADCRRFCYSDDGTLAYSQIQVTQKSIDLFFGEPTFRYLMFHELAHCLLGAQHNDTKNSLMYPVIPEFEENNIVGGVIKDYFTGLSSLSLAASNSCTSDPAVKK